MRQRPRRKPKIPPRDTVPERCPTGKRIYHDQAAADRAVSQMRVHARRARKPMPRRSYPCDECNGGWHITSLSREAFERITGAPS